MGCADDVDRQLVKCVLRLLLCPILLTANVQRIVAHLLCASVPQCVQLPALVSTLCLRGFIQLVICPAFLTHIGPTAHGRRQPGV